MDSLRLDFRVALRLLVRMSSGRSAISLDLNPNLRILAFTAAVSVLTGLLFGLAPALGATRLNLWPSLKSAVNQASRGRGMLRSGRVLAVFQLALSVPVLVGALLFIRSLQGLSGQDFGVARDRVLVVRVEPRGSDQRNIPGTTARLDRTYRDLLTACGNLVSMTSLGKTPSAAARKQRPRRPRPAQWQLQEAKARFSEVVRRAKEEGPQHVTVHGREEVVIIGADDYRRLSGERSGEALVDALQKSPHRSTGIEPPRSRMRIRHVAL